MADQYEIVDGHDNSGSLAAVTPQPRSTGIQYPAKRRFSASGAVYVDGSMTTTWIYDVLSRTERNTIYTQFGLSDTTIYNEVTIRTRGNDDAFAVYNATVVAPEVERDVAFWEDIEFKFINLESI